MKFSTLFRSAAVLGVLSLASVVAPDPVASQSMVEGPLIAAAGVSNVVATTHLLSAPLPPVQDTFSGNGQNVAMMIAGGAGIIVGGIVGGDGGTIIGVAGAVVGLIGLFRYLR